MEYILSHKHNKPPVFVKVSGTTQILLYFYTLLEIKTKTYTIFCNQCLYVELFSGQIIWLVGRSNSNYEVGTINVTHNQLTIYITVNNVWLVVIILGDPGWQGEKGGTGEEGGAPPLSRPGISRMSCNKMMKSYILSDILTLVLAFVSIFVFLMWAVTLSQLAAQHRGSPDKNTKIHW
jgi:hypothetical protein